MGVKLDIDPVDLTFNWCVLANWQAGLQRYLANGEVGTALAFFGWADRALDIFKVAAGDFENTQGIEIALDRDDAERLAMRLQTRRDAIVSRSNDWARAPGLLNRLSDRVDELIAALPPSLEPDGNETNKPPP